MYNERENIVATLDQACAVVPTLGFGRFEIIVVDDGSNDGSDEMVREWGERAGLNGQLRVVRHPENQGYGQALRSGFERAAYDVVFYTDSDLPVDLEDLRKALLLLESADMVIGYRTSRDETLRRKVYSRLYNGIVRVLLGVRARDVNFSFKMVRRAVLERVDLSAKGGFIDGELLAEARRLGFRVVEMPVNCELRKHGVSSFNSPKAALHVLYELLKYRADRLRGRGRPR
jgi:glycosyltransferase involved in cell wall biosynthesis